MNRFTRPMSRFLLRRSKSSHRLRSRSNSPLSPFFKRGKFSHRTQTPLWKRGEGEILRGLAREFCRELPREDTGFYSARPVTGGLRHLLAATRSFQVLYLDGDRPASGDGC